MMKRSLLILIFILLIVSAFYGEKVFDIKLIAGSSISSFLRGSFGCGESKIKIASLERENRTLKDQIANWENNNSELIRVYSTSPFNTSGKIAIAAGANLGIKSGDTVVYGGNVFVGTVTEVLDFSSIVTTIFNPSWEAEVRIGEDETDALIKGGNSILITLIPIDAQVDSGEKIVTASYKLPYGLEIGSVESLRDTDEMVFREATVRPSFELKTLRNVTIYR
jgi:cell shape-determining protein MreC